jgi:hypothetical protein
VAGKWVYDENITVLSAEGELLEKISIVDCIESSRFASLLDAVRDLHSDKPIDLLHPNTVHILNGNCAHLSPAFKKGNILTSFRNISTIAIIDPVEKKVVWALSHAWRRQHDPVLLDDGQMLLFDNAGPLAADSEERHSRVIEFNPLTQQITWSYQGTDRNPMFSSLMGTVQQLPEIVWEFKSPHTAGDQNQFVAVIPDMQRLSADFPSRFVDDP